MKKSLLLLPLLGVSALMCSCVTYPYSGPAYVGGGPVYEPGYVVAYGEPVYVYGGMNYYYYGGRYCYLDHGRRVYVSHIPHGACRYRGPSYMRHGSYATMQNTYRRDKYPQGPTHYPNVQGPTHYPNVQGPTHYPNVQGSTHYPNVQRQRHNPNMQKMGQSGVIPPKQGETQSNQTQKKKDFY